MKQIQFKYNTDIELKKKLNYVRRQCKKYKSKTVLFHIYSTSSDSELISSITSKIEETIPFALYVGCTTNNNIYDGKHSDEDVILICQIFEDPTTQIKTVDFKLNGKEADEIISVVESIQARHNWVAAIEVLVTLKGMCEGNLSKVFNRIKTKLTIFGGGAYSKDKMHDSLVFSNNSSFDDNSAVLIFYGGENLHFNTASVVGWKPLGQQFEITSANDNILHTLNDEPAFNVYSKYLNIKNDKFFSENALEFPLLCKTRDGAEILRDPVKATPEGSVVMYSEVDLFESARLTYGDRRTIMESIHEAAEDVAMFKPDGIEVFSCVARKAFWGDDIDRETYWFQDIAPTAGFYTSGEILTENGSVNHMNETLVIVGIREGRPDSDKPAVKIPDIPNTKGISLNSRLVNFISTATAELEQINKDLDRLVLDVEEAKNVAETANKAKSDFLANMSHEIRTPINAILGFNTMILRECPNDYIKKYALDIKHASTNLLAIINDILDLSKIESGKMEIVPVEYEFSSLVLDVVNMMKMKANDKGLDLILEVDPQLPAWLFGDDVRIRQIIINLMNNAIKYTEEGSVTLSISGKLKKKDVILHVEVKDTGIGIKPEDMTKLFEKFQRIEEQRNHYVEGTGLGMNITVSLLSMMKSKLKVSSVYGEGSVFSFDVAQKVLRDEVVGDIEGRINDSEVEEEYITQFVAPEADVLIVDDNEMNRKVIMGLLKHTKIRFEEADGGLTCLEMLKDKMYDVILLDHMMPDLDGIKTLHRIRDNEIGMNCSTPVICMTANAITGAQEEYIWEGFDDYISKPVNPNKLEKMLKEYLPPEKVMEEKVKAEEADRLMNDEGENHELDGLPTVDGMDLETAYRNLASKELMLKTMTVFANGAAAEAEYLEGYVDDIKKASDSERGEAIDRYRVRVHAMKSSAATIGAMMISNMAKFLEYSARDLNLDNIFYVTAPFLNEWRAFAGRLKTELEKTKATDAGELKPFNEEEISSIIDKLNDAVQEMDIDLGDELMKELKSYDIPAMLKVLVSSLESAVTNIDVDAVAKLATDIKEAL